MRIGLLPVSDWSTASLRILSSRILVDAINSEKTVNTAGGGATTDGAGGVGVTHLADEWPPSPPERPPEWPSVSTTTSCLALLRQRSVRASRLIYESLAVHRSHGALLRRQKVNNGPCSRSLEGRSEPGGGEGVGRPASWVARNMTRLSVADQYNNLSGHTRQGCADLRQLDPLSATFH